METDDEKDLVNCMKIFARFNPPDKHINLINSLILEKNIREMIEYLKKAKQDPSVSMEEFEAKFDNKKMAYLNDRLFYGSAETEQPDNVDTANVQKISQSYKAKSKLVKLSVPS